MATAEIQVKSDVAPALNGMKQVEAGLANMQRASDKVTMGGNRMAANMRQTANQTKASGQGMLQLAQFADDAQYGIRGILNNIPGVAMGLGASVAAAGGLSIIILGIAKILDGSAKRWGEALYDSFSSGEAAIREMNQAAIDFDTKNIARIEREKKAYEEMLDAKSKGDEKYLKNKQRREEFALTGAKLEKDISAERSSREQMILSGFLANRSEQLERPESTNFRIEAEKKLLEAKSQAIEKDSAIEKAMIDKKIQGAQEEFDLKMDALERSKKAETDLASIIGDKDDERIAKQKEITAESMESVEDARLKLMLAQQELHHNKMMTIERLQTADTERKLRLDALGQEILKKAEQDFMSDFEKAAGTSMTVGTQLQRVGLGKTPELVLQTNIAKQSERHLASIAKQIKNLSFGLN